MNAAVFYRILPIILAMALGACATTTPKRNPIVPLSVTTNPYTIAVLDQIEVRLRNGQTMIFTVGQDGALALPGGAIPAKGVRSDILEKRVRGMFPTAASVTVREFRTNRVTVLGEVFHQIYTDLGEGPMRLMDAIASANGFTPLANKRRVRLLRENAGRVEVYEFDLREMLRGNGLAQNFLLQPGDVITVPRNFL